MLSLLYYFNHTTRLKNNFCRILPNNHGADALGIAWKGSRWLSSFGSEYILTYHTTLSRRFLYPPWSHEYVIHFSRLDDSYFPVGVVINSPFKTEKQADAAFAPAHSDKEPSVMIEVGHSETITQLRGDTSRWFSLEFVSVSFRKFM